MYSNVNTNFVNIWYIHSYMKYFRHNLKTCLFFGACVWVINLTENIIYPLFTISTVCNILAYLL